MVERKIRMAETRLDGYEMANVIDCMKRGSLRAGEYVERLETWACRMTGATGAVAVTNGTTALLMVFKALKLRPGDKVVVPAFNFAASANAVILAGGEPVFCDVDGKTWCLSPDALADLLESDAETEGGPRIKAICPTHLFGLPCDIDRIQAIAGCHSVPVVYDGCQSFGARYKSRRIGTEGAATVFSLYPTKPLFGAEGGLIVWGPRSQFSAERAGANFFQPFREHGWTADKYRSLMVGGNFRMNELSAAIAVAQIEHGLFDARTRQRLLVADFIRSAIERRKIPADAQRVETNGAGIVLSWASMFSILAFCFRDRERVRLRLKESNIETGVHYPAGLHRQSSFWPYVNFGPGFEKTDILSQHILSIPCHHGMTIGDAERVVAEIEKAIK
jgi:dTDP-4-amino-4,6-dideoxygalactose transaminase